MTGRWQRSCDGTWWREDGPVTAFIDVRLHPDGYRDWKVYCGSNTIAYGEALTFREAKRAADAAVASGVAGQLSLDFGRRVK